MNAQSDYPGLARAVPSLPAAAYLERSQYERELQRVWFRHWLCVGRAEEIAAPRAFLRVGAAERGVLVVRDEDGTIHAFLDSCRHRGASLCAADRGRLARAALVCPYHSWSYDLRGRLLRTGSRREPPGLDRESLSLHALRVRQWNGFLFVSLSDEPPEFAAGFDQPVTRLDAWRLEDCVVAHRSVRTIACNWKVFWENYNECLHCPGVHPALSQLVPIYGRGLLEERDDPDWRVHVGDSDPLYRGGLRAGARSWTTSGAPVAAEFPGLDAEDRRAAHVYVTAPPSLFVVGHVDYARAVRLLPLGPDSTELRVDYLVARAAGAAPGCDPRAAGEFAERVLGEDAAICESNQRGLRAAPAGRGVLMPEEYAVKAFHDWLRGEGAVD